MTQTYMSGGRRNWLAERLGMAAICAAAINLTTLVMVVVGWNEGFLSNAARGVLVTYGLLFGFFGVCWSIVTLALALIRLSDPGPGAASACGRRRNDVAVSAITLLAWTLLLVGFQHHW
jgi:hypothetical protein